MDQALPPAPALLVSGVRKTYRLDGAEIPVLRGVDFRVEDGEFLAIQGSSGAGKSTLLHLLGLLDRPDEGSIRLFGREVALAPERERSVLRATELAFVFQFYFLLPEFTALENVVMAGLIARGRGRAASTRREVEERARTLLAQVGLGERLRHRPKELSGGERQRVAIARALVNRPRLLLGDEPTGNLDSRTASGIHDLLREVNQIHGQTMIVVTHEERMAQVASRRLFMRDGVLLPPAAS
jgi:lipoprotein-releasing system ATP-binding protein